MIFRSVKVVILQDFHNKNLKSEVLYSFVWRLNQKEKFAETCNLHRMRKNVLNVNEMLVWTPRLRVMDIIKGEFR